MKNLIVAMVAVAAVFVVSSSVQAQCGNRAFAVSSGFSNVQFVNGVGFAQQQFVTAPQSVGFFAASQPAFVARQFVSRPVAVVNQPVAVVSPARQDIRVRRGLFGNVRRVTVRNRGAAVVAPQQVIVGGKRAAIFVR